MAVVLTLVQKKRIRINIHKGNSTVIKLFNHLSLKIKSFTNEIKLFKPALKKFLHLHLFYTVGEYFEYNYNQESWFLYRDQ